MGSLEDQLKQWQKTQASQPAKTSSSSPQPTAKKPTKKNPAPLQTLRKPEPAPSKAEPPKPAPPKKKSDAELFAEAVDAVDEDVVLEKFSQAASSASSARGPSKTKDAPPPLTDEELFSQFVGDVNGAAEADGKKASRLVKLKK